MALMYDIQPAGEDANGKLWLARFGLVSAKHVGKRANGEHYSTHNSSFIYPRNSEVIHDPNFNPASHDYKIHEVPPEAVFSGDWGNKSGFGGHTLLLANTPQIISHPHGDNQCWGDEGALVLGCLDCDGDGTLRMLNEPDFWRDLGFGVPLTREMINQPSLDRLLPRSSPILDPRIREQLREGAVLIR